MSDYNAKLTGEEREKYIEKHFPNFKPKSAPKPKDTPILGYTYTELKEIINTIGKFAVETYDYYGLAVLSVGNREFAIGNEDECDLAWEEALLDYWDDCVIPEIPDNLSYYMDYGKWESDAKMDGRGHALSSYDGCETELDCGLILFQIN